MRTKLVLLGLLLAAGTAGSTAMAGSDANQVRLSGLNEDPLVLSTTGTGQFRARVDETKQEITYRLSYSALEGAVTQAHLHLGGSAQSGQIIVFLCTNAGNGPAGTQACPAAPATVTGTLKATDVIGPAPQGIAAGEFAEVARAIRAGAVYVNVHSAKYPAGEIRAQLGHNH
ncbi:CHRD domain-containing protein [Lentzea tibetensis]|nr:CHRD domain-containing protein [Lentzea tibetensis]